MTHSVTEALVSTWFDAWARSRGYETRSQGRVRSALRTSRPAHMIPGGSGRAKVDIPAAWEHVMVEPAAEELEPVLAELAENPEQMVTVFGEASADLEGSGLTALVDTERLMVIEMDVETIDVEPPLLPDGYEAQVDSPVEGSRRLRILATGASTAPEGENELAAMGWVTFENGTAVFDRIWTSPQHRRRGLGALVMRYLTSEAVADGEISEGLLVASPDGQMLYGHLGWTDLGPVSIWSKSTDETRPSPEHTGTMGR
ncbi:MAG: GNAT family N-acetyltransferase [Micrococcus sp.]|nr:GNAT family N-acetyltransferase [Micrococcus sp.]